MPSDEFPQPKSVELTQEQLERLLKVKIDPGGSFSDLFFSIKTGLPNKFIVDKDFNIFLGSSSQFHGQMIKNTVAGMYENCLISDGCFNFYVTSGDIEFSSYDVLQKGQNRKIFKVVKNKIKEFLKANGLEIRN